MMPSSQSSPLATNASDSVSICSSTAFVPAASASSSTSIPRRSAPARMTISMTPASCLGPITAVLWFGQLKMNRGSKLRPHMP